MEAAFYSMRKVDNRMTRSENAAIIIANEENDIVDYIKQYANTNAKQKLYLGTIGKELAERIEMDVNLDLRGYHISITNAFENSHTSEEKERRRGQIAITSEIVALVPRIITKYDRVEMNRKRNRNIGLKFTKDLDGRKTVVEYVSKGRHSLYLQTMYGKIKAAPSEEMQF